MITTLDREMAVLMSDLNRRNESSDEWSHFDKNGSSNEWSQHFDIEMMILMSGHNILIKNLWF